MSYILDALRRADSERERKRGGVPGLNAQPTPMESMDLAGRRRHRPWVWVVAGISLGLLMPLAWHLMAGDESTDNADAAATIARTPITGTVANSVTAQTPVPQAAPQPAPQAAPTVAPTPAIAPPPEPAGAVATPGIGASTPRAPATTKPARATNVASKIATAATRRTAPRAVDATPAPPEEQTAPEIRIPKLAELPEELRRAVPPLAFGGSVYSEVPAQRMVIMNGQLLREGEALSADLTLETIRAKSAVFRIKGEPFELVF
jgi:general secretion pathway protein B